MVRSVLIYRHKSLQLPYRYEKSMHYDFLYDCGCMILFKACVVNILTLFAIENKDLICL